MAFLGDRTTLAPGKEDVLVELIKNNDLNKMRLNASPRRVGITKDASNQWSVCLWKDGREKETLIGLETVTEVRHSQQTNIIQLTGHGNQMLTIRTKTRATKERWLNYLRSLTSEDIYEDEICEHPYMEPQTRLRAGTADQHVVRPRTTNARVAGDPQSELISDLRTIRVPPTPRPIIMGGLPEGEYDPGSFSSEPRSLNTLDEDPDDSRRDQGSAGEVHHTYDDGTAPTIIFNIMGPLTPIRSQQSTRRQGDECDERDFGVPNSTSSFGSQNSSERGRPALPPRNGDGARGQFPTPSPRRPDMRGAALPTPNQEANTQTEEESPYVNVRPPGIYVQRGQEQPRARRGAPIPPPRFPNRKDIGPAAAMRPTQMSGTIVHSISRHRLHEVGMQTLKSGGLWITHVPADLEKLFYHGDKILKINEQRMFDESFARNVIVTSEIEAIKVTIERLPNGHVVQIDRNITGESLGFQVDGTQITSICPGSSFAAQLAGSAMAVKMCVTHINDNYLPYMSRTDEVNRALQDAGRRFSIILQPLDLARELDEDY